MSLILLLSFDAPPASPAALDVAKEAVNLIGGEDIWFDVTAGSLANMIVTPAGDWLAATGMIALKQSLLRRTITNPNEWKTKPGYGVGAREYLKEKDTPAKRSELAARIRSQYIQDTRVERVDHVAIERFTDGIGAGLKVNVMFTPRGRLRTEQPATLSIEVR